ncbi:MAG: hypothetical protein ABFR97_08070 [Thermodesulfobacteriota bacterium]
MKKGFALAVVTVALVWGGTSCLAATYSLSRASGDNPAYSERDAVFFTDAVVECDDLHADEACELFRQTHPQYNFDPAFSIRDGVAFLADGVNCDDLHESDECELYQQEYRRPNGSALQTAVALDGELDS